MWQLTLEVKTFSKVLLLILLAISTILSWAESLRDPTQIPSNIMATQSGESNSIAPQPTGPVLQSVMLGAQYRAAIINGQKVKLGDKYEKATLVALSENSATLKNPDGTKQTLKMPESGVKKNTVRASLYSPRHGEYIHEQKEKNSEALLITSDSNPNTRMK